MNPGDRYGSYEVIQLIERGAMGEVYLAFDTEAQRRVALKVVYKGPEPEDQDILSAERLGAELQKRLSGVDRRVVIVNGYGEIAGDLFIDMEFIDGEDLSVVLARGALHPGFAVHVARELCEMLENLSVFTTTIEDRRFSGVIHGDLKPRNIRIDKQNQVKVLDFGIAKALTKTRKYTTNIFASSAYCSPERLETQNMDSHSDLWSVGVLLYQMIANRLPFDEPSKERLERRIRSYEPPGPLPSSCPEPLRRLIFKMLARDPETRYQTAREVSEDLGRFQRGQDVSAQPVRPAEVFDSNATVRTVPPPRTTPAGDGTVQSSPLIPQIRLPRRAQRVFGCAAIIGLTGVIGLGFAFGQMRFLEDADQLKTELQTERLSNLNEAWTRYEGLKKRVHLGALLWGAKRALKQRLVASADEIIAGYRNSDAPSVYEPQWVQARDNLSRALELDPDDNGIKGRFRLCEAHVDRIEANKQRSTTRQKRLDLAVNRFNEAADLLKRSPDPYLGLASLYIYDMGDVARAQDALNKAERNGHPMGNREIALLADGFRRRADRIWRQSRSFTQMPDEERNFLEKAKRDYLSAQNLYQRAGLFGDAARNQLQAIQGEQKVEQRLTELQGNTVIQ